ncbi:MAG: hypothetical protein EZS28_006211 [Streblomastix strix]|uniref:Uncharacterized protein n=1 Tax=Streblomastix strix TaxID=222440 RepID=A0A5J4WTG4_9EUKA|nr:MAG: hypothetical protein EZS28_006211 [Streblomastix strix]
MNNAETSDTIEQIKYTIDYRQYKVKKYQPKQGFEALVVERSLELDNLIIFDFIDPPETESIMRTVEQQFSLGTLNSRGELIKPDQRIAEFPVDPQSAKSILTGINFGATKEILSISYVKSIDGEIFNRLRRSGKEKDNIYINKNCDETGQNKKNIENSLIR